MNDVMTREEIEAQFPDEWILIEDPQLDEYRGVQGGKVVCHSKDRDEVYRYAIARRGKSKFWATLYTGSMPPDTAIVL